MQELPEHDRGRPGERAASKLSDDDYTRVPGADLACRVATLRVYATEEAAPESIWLACQLLDLADLLECAEREGWFG